MNAFIRFFNSLNSQSYMAILCIEENEHAESLSLDAVVPTTRARENDVANYSLAIQPIV